MLEPLAAARSGLLQQETGPYPAAWPFRIQMWPVRNAIVGRRGDLLSNHFIY